MFFRVAKVDEIAPGGMKAVNVKGKEIVLCNYDGTIYAVDRRCGHLNAPLELGTLEGYIVTCPLHYAQFDITTGEALSGPVPRDFGKEVPEGNAESIQKSGIKIHDIKTYPVSIEGDAIYVEILP